MADILAGDPHPTMEYEKGSMNLIADSLSRLRTGEHYNHNFPLEQKLPELQIKVRDMFKTSDKWQLIMNADKA